MPDSAREKDPAEVLVGNIRSVVAGLPREPDPENSVRMLESCSLQLERMNLSKDELKRVCMDLDDFYYQAKRPECRKLIQRMLEDCQAKLAKLPS